MSRIAVLIVDDHAMVRKGLRMLLDAEPDIQVVGEAGTVGEAIEIAPRLAPTIITLDLSMPGPSGVASIERSGSGRRERVAATSRTSSSAARVRCSGRFPKAARCCSPMTRRPAPPT